MSHVSSHRAHATDHSVRRYAERLLGLDAEGLDDPAALARAHAQGIDCEAVRRHLASLGGVILAAGMRSGVVVVPADRISLRVKDGRVVTIVTAPVRRPTRHLRRAA